MRMLNPYIILAIVLMSLPRLASGQEQKAQYRQPNLDSVRASVIGKKYPGFSVTLDNGKKISSDSVRGKVMLVNFWFEHCAPCRAEFNALNKLYDSLKGNTSFALLTITYESAETIKRIRKESGIRFPVASVPRDQIKILKIAPLGYPVNMIVNKEGIVTHNYYGGPIVPAEAEKKILEEVLPAIHSQL